MEILGNDLGAISGKNNVLNFFCKYCDYSCCKKYDWTRHLSTAKHRKALPGNDFHTISGQKGQTFQCSICEKYFKTNAGLWKHKNKCISINSAVDVVVIKEDANKNNNINKDDLILELLKQNKELLEIVKNGTHNTTHTNSHNKAFNLNFFLNETCKNAMNINDFIDSIKLQLPDLIDVGEIGFVEGISKIIVKNLNNLDETERPIHCTDKKRETMYIKDADKWEKEDDKKSKLITAVKKIADKNIRLLPQFREKYPEYSNSYSKVSDKYDKIVIEAMTTDENKTDKIIKNISKVTTIKNSC
jgi:hypothetical protein